MFPWFIKSGSRHGGQAYDDPARVEFPANSTLLDSFSGLA
jgi:hypothetical protein